MSNKYFAHEPKQDRSHARVEKILDAVESLSIEKPARKIDVKSISKKAYISVGAIYHHFPSVNSIFASLLLRKVQARIKGLTNLIDSLEPTVDLEKFADLLIDQAFYEWGQKSVAAKNEALEFYYQNANHPEFIYSYAEALYPHVNAFIKRNQTNTFRDITEEEWPFLNRASQTAILSPFLEKSPIAGSEKHKAIVKDLSLRIYSK